jgi:hypothetical protein
MEYIMPSSTFDRAVRRERRLNVWKMKPIFWPRRTASSPLVYPEISFVGEVVLAGSCLVQATDQVEERRLSRSGGAHDGRHLSINNAEVDPFQDREVRLAHMVGFPDVLELYQRITPKRPPPGPCGWLDEEVEVVMGIKTVSPSVTPSVTSVNCELESPVVTSTCSVVVPFWIFTYDLP